MGGIASTIGNLFKKPKKAVIPKVAPVKRRPVEGSQSKEEARRRQQLAARKRKGRDSTILSDELRELTGSSGRSLGG